MEGQDEWAGGNATHSSTTCRWSKALK